MAVDTIEDRDDAAGGDTAQGVFITGEFLKVTEGRRWTGADSVERVPGKVVLLVNDRSMEIEYPSLGDAEHFAGGATRGDLVTLAVFPRARTKDGPVTVRLNGPRAPRS